MRVLIVVDNLQDPATRADLELLTKQLDPKRIQLLVCAMRTTQGEMCDINLVARHRFDISAYFRLIRIAREYDVELIHVLEPSIAPGVALAARYGGFPIVATCHKFQWLPDRVWLRQRLQRFGWWFYLKSVDQLIIPSDVIKRNLGYLTSDIRDKAAIIYRGLNPPDPDCLPEKAVLRGQLGLPEGPLVTMLPPRGGEVDEGYTFIFEVLHRLMKRQPEIHLAVIGTGATVTDLQRKASSIRPALPFWWLGDSPQVWEAIIASDVIIDCLSVERVPEGLVMAALVGKPIVAPRLAGVTEVVEPNVSGLLITPGDASDLSIQISRLLQYEGLSHRLGRMARRRGVERFSVEAQREAMTSLYESAVYATR